MAHVLNLSSTLMCPHLGTVSATTTNDRVLAGGDFGLRATDTFTITGCPFNVGTSPHPCVTVQWVQTAILTKVLDDFVLTDDSVGLCLAGDQAPQGTVQVVDTQAQVEAQ